MNKLDTENFVFLSILGIIIITILVTLLDSGLFKIEGDSLPQEDVPVLSPDSKIVFDGV